MNKISKLFSKTKESMVFDWDKAARLIKNVTQNLRMPGWKKTG